LTSGSKFGRHVGLDQQETVMSGAAPAKVLLEGLAVFGIVWPLSYVFMCIGCVSLCHWKRGSISARLGNLAALT
jgi:hypothetical protein